MGDGPGAAPGPRYVLCPECAGGRVDCPTCDGEQLIEVQTPGQVAADDQLLEELRDAMQWRTTPGACSRGEHA